jgi:lipopolysaccharide kinase (Kdo/WaaP) family protein
MLQKWESVERDGWRLFFATGQRSAAELANAQFVDDPELVGKTNADLVEQALAAACGRLGRPFRRSRHALTWWVRNGGNAAGVGDRFIKVLDAPRGLRKLKHLLSQPREEYVACVVDELVAADINAAPVLIYGHETATGRGIIVTARAPGKALPVALRMTGAEGLPHKRALLHALGEEVARLHTAGFIHGDLTPYNVIVELGKPPRFVFIDHERTCRAPIVGRMRHRLRNLVQLGRLELPGLTRADRVRVLRAYADALGVRNPRRLMRRTVSMLARRLERDRERARTSLSLERTRCPTR